MARSGAYLTHVTNGSFSLTPPEGSVGGIRIDRSLYLNRPSPDRLARIIRDQAHLPDFAKQKKILVFVFGMGAEKRAQAMSHPKVLTRGILVDDDEAMMKTLTGLVAQGVSTQDLFYEDGPRAKRTRCPAPQVISMPSAQQLGLF